jgi:hypothetical protein
VTLQEAAGVLIRHWEMFGTRGFEAAVNQLRRVLERERSAGSPPAM